jgi:membrane protein implicated in regulation of membrane protease activity
MTEKKRREPPVMAVPVRSLHDFLSELDQEWDKFRTGSLIGMITSAALGFFIIWFLRGPIGPIIRSDPFFFAFVLLIAVMLIYSIFALYAQYKFFSKWERRIGLLRHLEEKLIGEKLDERIAK